MSKNSTTKKAVVAMIQIGNKEVEGLMLPDGKFAIAVPQIWKLLEFSVQPTDASRSIKRLLGNGFQYSRVRSELNPKKVNIVDISTFELILAKLDRRGNKKAQDFRDDLVGLSLYQLFCDAFNQKFEREERQQWLSSRQQSKVTRRNMTNVVRDYVKAHDEELSDNYKKFIYNNCTDRVYRLVFGRSAKKLKKDWECNDVRAAMTVEELFIVRGVEDLAMKLIEQGTEPQQAIDEAGKRLMIKKIGRK